jgi:hypothetical protein
MSWLHLSNSHLFAQLLYLPRGVNELMKFAACFIAAYVFFRGLCVIINNACCRIIEWADEPEPTKTLESIKEYGEIISDAEAIASAVAELSSEELACKAFEFPYKPFAKAGLGNQLISKLRAIFVSRGVGDKFFAEVRRGRLFVSTYPLPD